MWVRMPAWFPNALAGVTTVTIPSVGILVSWVSWRTQQEALRLQTRAFVLEQKRYIGGQIDSWVESLPAFDPSKHPAETAAQCQMLKIRGESIVEGKQSLMRDIATLSSHDTTLDAITADTFARVEMVKKQLPWLTVVAIFSRKLNSKTSQESPRAPISLECRERGRALFQASLSNVEAPVPSSIWKRVVSQYCAHLLRKKYNALKSNGSKKGESQEDIVRRVLDTKLPEYVSREEISDFAFKLLTRLADHDLLVEKSPTKGAEA